MNGKAKQIGLALVFATIVCLSVFTYSLHGNYPIEEAEGKATAEAFLSALQAKDYDAIAALYHPDEEMDTETLRKEFEPDKITRFIDLNDDEIANTAVGNFYSNSGRSGRHGYRTSYGVIFTLTADGRPCTGVLTLKKNAEGYGIWYYTLVPYKN